MDSTNSKPMMETTMTSKPRNNVGYIPLILLIGVCASTVYQIGRALRDQTPNLMNVITLHNPLRYPSIPLEDPQVPRIALLFIAGDEGLTGLQTWTKWIELAFEEEQELGDFGFLQRYRLKDYAPSENWRAGCQMLPYLHEAIRPTSDFVEYLTSYESIFELPSKPQRCGKVPQRASIYTMVHGAEDVEAGISLHGKVFPNYPFNCTGVGPARTLWGSNLPPVLRLYKAALEDPQNQFFVVISGTTLPVRPFSDLYDFVVSENRSLFSVMNPSLSNYGFKHEEWTILNRKHATILVEEHKATLLGPYLTKGAFAPDDQSRQSFVLSLKMGEQQLWREINPELGSRPPEFRQRRKVVRRTVGGEETFNLRDYDIPFANDVHFPTTLVSWTKWDLMTYDSADQVPPRISGIHAKSLFDLIGSLDYPYFFIREIAQNACCILRNETLDRAVDQCWLSEIVARQRTYMKYQKLLLHYTPPIDT